MLSLQWVTVVQKICLTDGLWVSWLAQLVAIMFFFIRPNDTGYVRCLLCVQRNWLMFIIFDSVLHRSHVARM